MDRDSVELLAEYVRVQCQVDAIRIEFVDQAREFADRMRAIDGNWQKSGPHVAQANAMLVGLSIETRALVKDIGDE
jgi:hypothetical protein